jgi:hypothetical protein
MLLSDRKHWITIVLAFLLGLWATDNLSSTAAVTAAYPAYPLASESGESLAIYDEPNSVVLDYVEAVAVEGQAGQVEILWRTNSELGTAGFYVMRGITTEGPFEQANQDLILAEGEDLGGASYSYLDSDLSGGITYHFYIREVQTSGGSIAYTELMVSAVPWHGVYLPMVVRQ